jgi:hypothetical protein
MWMQMWDEAIWVCCTFDGREEAPRPCQGHCSHLHMASLGSNNIGDAGAWDLGAALQVNTTLTTLE